METKSKETKELVIMVDKNLYDEIKKVGLHKTWDGVREQAEYLYNLLWSEDWYNKIKSEDAKAFLFNITSMICQIPYLEEPVNIGLNYDYTKFDEFISDYTPTKVREWLADVLFDYSGCIDEGNFKTFKNNADSLGCLSVELSNIVPIV